MTFCKRLQLFQALFQSIIPLITWVAGIGELAAQDSLLSAIRPYCVAEGEFKLEW